MDEVFGGFSELPVTDIPFLKDVAERVMAYYKQVGDKHKARELFFSLALVGFYDCMAGGLKSDAGHIIYRFSDYVDPDERAKIEIYPGKDRWDNLKDWRAEWEKLHRAIPDLDPARRIGWQKFLALPEAT